MSEIQPLNETILARECLSHLSEEKSILHPVVHILDLLARSSVGLGEVLQDYARQSGYQLHEILRVASLVSHGASICPEDVQILGNIHFTFKTVKSVLEMTPAAMRRNKAEAVGVSEKEKLSCADIAQVTDSFLRTPEIVRLLAAEDSGVAFAGLALAEPEDGALPAPGVMLSFNTVHH